MQLQTSAPGKVILCGEYSVLDGYPALVAAIDRFAVVTSVQDKQLSLSSHLGHEALCHLDGQTYRTQEADGFFSKCLSLFNQALALGYVIENRHFHIDTTQFYAAKGTHKLGIGSSAAVLVAMAKHILKLNNKGDDLVQVFELAYATNQQLTSGLSSGIDIAASTFSGLLSYQLVASEPQLHTYELAQTPSLLCIYTGKSQSTQDYVEKVIQLSTQNPLQYHARMEALGIANGRLMDILLDYFGGNDAVFDELFSACSVVNKSLSSLQEAAGITILDPSVQKIIHLVESLGGCAKPSGAGGGDIVLCFIPTIQKESLLRLCHQHDLALLSFHIS